MLVPWKPFFEPMDEFEKMMDNFSPRAPIGFSPALDIYEKGKDLIIEAPISGIDPEKIEVNIQDDVLTIQGKMEKKSEVEDKNYYRREVCAGSFFRQVALPSHVLGEKATANYEDGVLKVVVPKAEPGKGKKIEVKVGKNGKK